MDIQEQIELDRRRANETLDHHLNYGDYGDWYVMSSKLEDYNREFKNVLFPLTGNRSIQNAIHQWGIPPAQLIGVNFMGETLPLDELGVSGFGCELIDNKRDDSLRERDKEMGRTVVEGDLDQERTWENIKTQLAGKKINVALWRSVGGASTLPVLPHSIFRQINKAYSLMDNKNGLYLADLTTAASIYDEGATPLLVNFIHNLVDSMNTISGIEANYSYDYQSMQLHGREYPILDLSFGYTLKEGAPDKLPLQEIREKDQLLDQWIEMSENYVPRGSQYLR